MTTTTRVSFKIFCSVDAVNDGADISCASSIGILLM